MPHYIAAFEIACPVSDLFTFFSKPKNLVQLAPPDLHLELLTAPEIMERGARLVWKGRRWGVSQQITQEVATFEHDRLIALEQKQGPFARWLHAHHFEMTVAGTRIVEKIDFEPPGGILGWMVTVESIRKDLDRLLAFREKKLKQIFALP